MPLPHRRVETALRRSRGFTLIELLVVIAIIGLLASVVITSLGRTRVRARDSRRAQDLHTIQTALELYASDNNHYPNSNGTWASFDAPAYINNPIVNPNATNLSAALQPYLSSPPKDPTPGIGDDGYLYLGNGTSYCVLMWYAPEDMRNFESHLIPTTPNRCPSINASGQCLNGSNQVVPNAIFIGTGSYASGC